MPAQPGAGSGQDRLGRPDTSADGLRDVGDGKIVEVPQRHGGAFEGSERPEQLSRVQVGQLDAPEGGVGRGPMHGDIAVTLAPGARVAIANPAIAPYGAAAIAALADAGIAPAALDIVTGDSVGQVAAFVVSGNAEFGFLALSQVRAGLGGDLSYAEVPSAPGQLVQEAALLDPGAAAGAFYDWLGSDEARRIIAAAGYDLPEVRE